MSSIWKFALRRGLATVEVPAGSTPLAIGCGDDDYPCTWMIVDPYAPLVERYVDVVFIGEEFNANSVGAYVGTATMRHGLVYHVFIHPDGSPVYVAAD